MDINTPNYDKSTSSLVKAVIPDRVVIPPEKKARVTVVHKVYHNTPDEPTSGPQPISFHRWLDSDERPYTRTVKVGENWQPIELGWLENVGISYIALENDSKRPLGKIPTPEEAEEWAKKVLEYGIYIGEEEGMVRVGYLLPEEGTGFSPCTRNLMVRCRKGEGRLTYFAVPI